MCVCVTALRQMHIDLCAYTAWQLLCHQYKLFCQVELFIELIFHRNCLHNCTRAHTIGKCLVTLLYSDEQRAVNGYWKSQQMRTFSAGYCAFQKNMKLTSDGEQEKIESGRWNEDNTAAVQSQCVLLMRFFVKTNYIYSALKGNFSLQMALRH